jgi:hypothetical protein
MHRLLVFAMTVCVAPQVFGADCQSAVAVSQHLKNGKLAYLAKNISSKPIIAYVVATDRDARGNFVHVFSGVFTEGDSLQPGSSIVIGPAPSSRSDGKAVVDYVRLAGGWSCGASSTEEAREVIARFGK